MNGLHPLPCRRRQRGLLAGGAALDGPQGRPPPRRAGTIFFATMLAMAGTGALMRR